jgi:hypothetical protein
MLSLPRQTRRTVPFFLTGLLLLSLYASALLTPLPAHAATYNRADLERYIRDLEAILADLYALRGQSSASWSPAVGRLAVTTQPASAVTDDAATMRGSVNIPRGDEVLLSFQWGTRSSSLSEETGQLVVTGRSGRRDFSARIERLTDNRTYYYRAVVEDERGRRSFGQVQSFTTDDGRGYTDDDDGDDYRWYRNRDDDRDHDEYPDVTTGRATAIMTTWATIEGRVDMNDAADGIAFVAYGEDEDLVEDIADEYNEYEDIKSDGDDLRTLLLTSNLDETRSFTTSLSGLDEDTDIYYAFCVEFEDEDNEDTIVCGDTRSFTTDED